MVPYSPTETNNSFEVDELSFEFDEVLESESFFAHDIIKVTNTMTPINEKIFLFTKTSFGNYEILIHNPTTKETSSHSMNLHGSLWRHGGGEIRGGIKCYSVIHLSL